MIVMVQKQAHTSKLQPGTILMTNMAIRQGVIRKHPLGIIPMINMETKQVRTKKPHPGIIHTTSMETEQEAIKQILMEQQQSMINMATKLVHLEQTLLAEP